MNVDKIANIINRLVHSREEQVAIEILRSLDKENHFNDVYSKLQFCADLYSKLHPKVMQKIVKSYK